MNDVSNAPIGDFEIQQRDNRGILLILNVGTVSQTVRSGNGPYKKKKLDHYNRLGFRFRSPFPLVKEQMNGVPNDQIV
jgi:hypothetical protein